MTSSDTPQRGAVNTRHPYWPDLTEEEGDILTAYFDATCGDCREGRCHWGSLEYQRRAAEAGQRCGCTHHAASVAARRFERFGEGKGDRSTIETALAWHRARERRSR